MDITDVTSAVEVGSISEWPGTSSRSASTLAPWDHFVAVANEGGVAIVDAGVPSAPVVVGHLPPNEVIGPVRLFAARDGYVYGISRSGLQVIRATDPTSPAFGPSVAIVDAEALVVDGTSVLVSRPAADIVQLIDITNPNAPVQAQHLDLVHDAIEVSGDLLYSTSAVTR